MDQRSLVQKELRRLRSMPRILWVVLGAGVVFLLANVVTLLSTAGLKIDPGTATLFGAVAGLCVVAWQTNKGFGNLIRSQENQARIERDGRLHALELERTRRREQQQHEKQLFTSGLRAEMVSLHNSAWDTAKSNHQFAVLYKAMHENGVPASIKEYKMLGFKSPFYKENIGKLGLLSVSLAADVIRVFSAVRDDLKVVWEKPAPNSVVSLAYATAALMAYHFQSDLHHVAMRIRAAEESTLDPGTLSETQAARYATLPKLEDMIPNEMA